MRTLCDSCEAAAAQFFCAADEAALCAKCDEKVHSCNKLASRHLRLQLREAWSVPRCDICETAPVSMDHLCASSVIWMFIKGARELTRDTCYWDRESSYRMVFIIVKRMGTREAWMLPELGRKNIARSTSIVQFLARKSMPIQTVIFIMLHILAKRVLKLMGKKTEHFGCSRRTCNSVARIREHCTSFCCDLFEPWLAYSFVGLTELFRDRTDFQICIMYTKIFLFNMKTPSFLNNPFYHEDHVLLILCMPLTYHFNSLLFP